MGSKSQRKHAQKQYNRAQNKPVEQVETTTVDATIPAVESTSPIMTAKDFRKLEKERVKQAKLQAKETAKKEPVKDKEPKKEGKKGFFLFRFFRWIGRSFAEIGSELKKVHWPTFKQIVKSTGVVLGIVVVFGLVLFGIWSLLGFLYDLLITI